MNLKNLFITIHSVIIVLLICLGVVAMLTFQNRARLKHSHEIRYKSFVIADELRQSSDDLTRYCRTCIATGDTIWERRYYEVLDIRNGIRPRPDGKTIALQDSMSKLGFTNAEFDKLKEAERNSNDLVWTELVAFNAMRGLYDDGTGNFTLKKDPDPDMARRILFDQKYHDDKASIMDPIDDFFVMLDKRTANIVKKYDTRNNWLLVTSIGLIILIAGISIISFFVIIKGIINQLHQLNREILEHRKTELELQKQRDILEDKVIERTQELARAKEAAEDANRLKSQFLANVSHELRTPLNIIQGNNQILSMGIKDKSLNDPIKNINESVTQLTELISNILDYSLIEKELFNLEVGDFSLSNLLGNIKLLYEKLAVKKELEFSCNNDPSIPNVLRGDSKRLLQALTILVDNAIKFTESGFVTVNTRLISKNEDAYRIQFTVRDSGIGITKEQQKFLFRSFTQGDGSDTRKYGGVGLGLSLCNKIIGFMGGKVEVESEAGNGSVFSFELEFGKSDLVQLTMEPLPEDAVTVEEITGKEEPIVQELNKEKLLQLSEELIKLLTESDTEALNKLNEIGVIPGLEEEQKQMEEMIRSYDFEAAAVALKVLMKKFPGDFA